MKHKTLLTSSTAIYLTLAVLLSAALPAVTPTAPVIAQGTSLSGDITGDGVVDGRDALRIMRVVDGYETATAEEIARGDVHPLPGADGRLMGDGQLTRADAEKILRGEVRLLPLGEVSGDFSGSPPAISEFFPAHGPAGTPVTIYGENFVAATPDENIVLFGDAPAPVLSSTGTTLVAEAPQGSESSKIRVITPGGEAISPYTFDVMMDRPGRLIPPGGFSAADYDVVNHYGDAASPQTDGRFSIPMNAHGVTVHYAAPNDGSDRLLMLVDIAGGLTASAEPPQEASMDLASTAQGLVFLTAYLGSSLAEMAGQHMAIIRDDSKVAELAQVLDQLYRETPEPFDDPRFEAAYKAAIGSVLERLPEALKLASFTQAAGAGAGRVRVFQVDGAALEPGAAGSNRPHVTEPAPLDALGVNWQASVFYPDSALTSGEAHFASPWAIQPRGYPGNPVDWFTFLAEVEDIYDAFPQGLDSVRTMKYDQVAPRIGGQTFTFIASSSYTQYVDWFGFAFGQFWDAGMDMLAEVFSLQGAASPDGNLHLTPDKAGVYMVRVFSGATRRADPTEHSLIPRLEDGQLHADIALWTNALLAGVDLASVFLDVKDLGGDRVARKIAQKATKLALKRAAKKGATAPFEWTDILAAAYDVAKDIATVVAGDKAGIAVKNSSKTVLKAILRSIDPFFKLSVGAAAFERLLSLDGRHPAFDITPLETWIVVVGDPFTPTVEEIQPDTAAPGTEVTLRGRNFDYRKAQNNEVRLGALWETATAAEVLQVSADGKTLIFRVPDDQPQAQTVIWIKTPYTFHGLPVKQEMPLNVKRFPRLRQLSRATGFGPVPAGAEGPFAGYAGTQVVLTGTGLQPTAGAPADQVFFGATQAQVLSVSATTISVLTPNAPAGQTEVYINSPEHGVKTQRLPFTVVGAPQLTSVTPASAQPGYILTLEGSQFDDQDTTKVEARGAAGGKYALLRDVSADTIMAQMPTVGEPGEALTVRVWTPAGASEARALVREAGLATPDPPACPAEAEFPLGYHILVNEAAGGHKLSFDDANEFINGADPFAPPYDDRDAVYEWVWEENEQCAYEVEPQDKRGPFYSYHKGQYNYDFDGSRGHPGAEREIIMRINRLRPDCHNGQGGETDPVRLIDGSQDAPEEGWDGEVKCDETHVADDCPEEGDFVGYRTASQVGGVGYADLIEFDPGVASFQGSSFQPDDGDTLTGRGNLILSGNITIQSVNQVHASGIERAGGIVISGDGTAKGARNDIAVGIVGSGGIKLTNALCNDVEATEIRGGAVGAEINRGARNLVEVLGPVSAASDGVQIKNSIASAVSTGWIESPGGHGAVIEGGGRNGFTGGVRSSGQTAVYLNETIASWAGATVEGASGLGFEIVGGGLNAIGGSADSTSGDGVRVANSSENEIDVKAVNCGGHGIALLDVRGHTLSGNVISGGATATGCAKSGLYIQGGGEHEIAYFVGTANTGHGIELDNTMHNTLGYITAAGNAGNGLYLHNGTSFTAFTAISGSDGDGIWDNQNGIVIEGPMTSHNEVGNAGVRFRLPEDDEYPGNRQNGIVIQDGAHHNTVYGAYGNQHNGMVLLGGAHHNTLQAGVVGNRQHGILAEEAHDNTIAAGQVSDNDGDGIRIGAQAANTTVWGDSGIYGNGANGIAVLGTGTVIRGSHGLQIGQTSQYAPRPNQGFGIFVDGATGTTITSVEVGRNEAGGIRVQNVNRPAAAAAGADPLITIGNVHVGYEKIYPDGKPPYYLGIDGLPAEGVDFENCTDVRYAAHVYGHQVGLHIGGRAPASARFNLSSGSVTSSTETGIELLYLQDSDVNLYAAHNGSDGIMLFEGRNVRFVGNMNPTSISDLSASRNGGSGISIEKSENITIGHAGRGFSNNGLHGISIGPESRHIELIGVRASGNQGAGVFIQQASDVNLSPAGSDPLGTGSRFRDNAAAGVKIEDAQRVRLIALPGEANDIGGGNRIGVEVLGQDSDDIAISGWYIHENREAGICVADATDVLIGGFGEDEGNSIGQNKHGIVASGVAAQVTIANNHIWRNQPLALRTGMDWRAGPAGRLGLAGPAAEPAGVGVVLDGGIAGAVIEGNRIRANQSHGILITGAAQSNVVRGNTITDNGAAGIHVAGPGAIHNILTTNAITGNQGKGIELASGGNNEIPAPVIEQWAWGSYNIAGRALGAPTGSRVEVYADAADEGERLVGATALLGEKFYVSAEGLAGPQLHAIIIYPNGDTSEFGPTGLASQRDALVFTSTRDGNPEIYAHNAGQGQPSRLTSDPAADHSPRLSADGSRLLFVSERAGNPDIWLMTADGATPAQLTGDASAEYDPAWAPDGSRMAFVSEREGNPEIYTLGLGAAGPSGELAYDDGSAEFGLAAPSGHAYGVHFTQESAAGGAGAAMKPLTAIRFWIAADPAAFTWQVYDWGNGQPGPLIAEGRTTPQGTGWYTVELSGVEVGADFLVGMRYTAADQPKLGFDLRQQASDRSWLDTGEGWWRLPAPDFIMIRARFAAAPVRLTAHPATDRQADWCADGSKIVFTSERNGNADIWVMDADGALPHALASHPAADYQPVWSPDCSQIAFVSERDGDAEIYLLDAAGGAVTRLTDHPASDRDPAWSSDGSRILFSADRGAGREIYALRLASADLQRLTTSLGDNYQPDANGRIAALAGAGDQRPRNSAPAPASLAPDGRSDNPIQVALPAASVRAGETFTVPVTISGAQALGRLTFDIVYDPLTFTLLRAAPGEMVGTGGLFALNPERYPDVAGRMQFSWVHAAGFNGAGAVLQLTFQVEQDAEPGVAPLTFQPPAASDITLAALPVAAQDGQITVSAPPEWRSYLPLVLRSP